MNRSNLSVYYAYNIGIVLVALLVGSSIFLSQEYEREITQLAGTHLFLGAFFLMLFMAATTIVAPLTSLPLVPVLAPILGPFVTGLAAYCGWLLERHVFFI